MDSPHRHHPSAAAVVGHHQHPNLPKKQKKVATPDQRQHPTNNNIASPNGAASFRNLQLPVASFSLSSASVPKTTSVTTPRPPSPQHEPAPTPPPKPLPVATPAHLKWKDAVIATRKHDNYNNAFDFERKQQEEFAAGISSPHHWIESRNKLVDFRSRCGERRY